MIACNGLGFVFRGISGNSSYVYLISDICHGISIFPFGDLSAPGASLRPPALVMLARDTVKARYWRCCLQTTVARTVT